MVLKNVVVNITQSLLHILITVNVVRHCALPQLAIRKSILLHVCTRDELLALHIHKHTEHTHTHTMHTTHTRGKNPDVLFLSAVTYQCAVKSAAMMDCLLRGICVRVCGENETRCVCVRMCV